MEATVERKKIFQTKIFTPPAHFPFLQHIKNALFCRPLSYSTTTTAAKTATNCAMFSVSFSVSLCQSFSPVKVLLVLLRLLLLQVLGRMWPLLEQNMCLLWPRYVSPCNNVHSCILLKLHASCSCRCNCCCALCSRCRFCCCCLSAVGNLMFAYFQVLIAPLGI